MPEGGIDPLLRTITLLRGDKPLVRMHYYATHPQTYYLDGRASYDFPGMARQRLQEEEGVFVSEGGTVKFAAVTTGLAGESNIEIVTCLKEGQEIVTGPFKALREIKEGSKVKKQEEKSKAS